MNILYRIKDEILPKNKLLSLLDEKKIWYNNIPYFLNLHSELW